MSNKITMRILERTDSGFITTIRIPELNIHDLGTINLRDRVFEVECWDDAATEPPEILHKVRIA